ncbi:DUF4276 family protein [Methanoculleus bourgensis]|uniref:DUF4276 family protein n=1 Tax=Methanoculleus bourgensis TaxID=83986 RepID=UPI0022EF6444|nr:DUF4276 family protein [Methanoculleus bourgensis]GLI46265.1 hypothetical protein MBOURGENBZM_10570 [Methanoculleus bourgensis]
MKAKIYLEGGGDSRELRIRCRAGFRRLLESAGFKGKMPQLIACGGRNSTYDDFTVAHMHTGADYIAMLIDSEEPVTDPEKTWDHLRARDGWAQPDGSNDEQVLFMTTCMETWIASDADTLRQHYGSCFRQSALPSHHNIEQRDRHDIQERLKEATCNCAGAYQKNVRSFEVLGKLNPAALEPLASFQRTKRILHEKLQK